MKYFRYIRIVAALLFIGGFLGAMKGIPFLESLLQIQFGPALLRFFTSFTCGAAAAVGSILILTLLLGRLYCSVLCPLGILQDVLGLFSKKNFRNLPLLKGIRYPLLVLILTLVAFGTLFPATWLLPSSNFVMLVNGLFSVNSGAFLAAWVMLLLLLLLVRWQGRLYCNTLCPVGAILSLVARFSLFKIQMKENCIGCGKCGKSCKAACIDIKNRKIHNANCVMCLDCLSVCPLNAMTYALPFASKKAVPETVSDTTPQKAHKYRRAAFITVASFLGYLLGRTLGLNNQPEPDALKADSQRKVLPPGAWSYVRFRSKCVGCGLCVGVCQGHSLTYSMGQFGLDGTLQPYLDFNRGKCLENCSDCMTICPTGAIEDIGLPAKKTLRLGIGGYDPTICRAFTGEDPCGDCEKACPVQAITLVDFKGKKIPKFNDDLCIGCGACQYVCPVVPKSMQVIPAIEQNFLADLKTAQEGDTK